MQTTVCPDDLRMSVPRRKIVVDPAIGKPAMRGEIPVLARRNSNLTVRQVEPVLQSDDGSACLQSRARGAGKPGVQAEAEGQRVRPAIGDLQRNAKRSLFERVADLGYELEGPRTVGIECEARADGRRLDCLPRRGKAIAVNRHRLIHQVGLKRIEASAERKSTSGDPVGPGD